MAMNMASSLPPSVQEDAKKLIGAVGYKMAEADAWALQFCARATEQELQNACNLPEVPEGLYTLAARLTAAAFLDLKRTNGALDPEGLSFEPALKELREGDTEVVFDAEHTMSAGQRLDAFLALCRAGREQCIRYRRLVW